MGKLNNKKVLDFISYFFLILVFLLIYLLPNDIRSLSILGLLIVVVSLINIIKYWNNRNISLLIGIISIISICYAMSLCFNVRDTAFNWQVNLIALEENIINVKNFLLFVTTLFIAIGNIKFLPQTFKTKNKYNSMIIIGGILVLVYILIFCFDRTNAGQYSSNGNPLYEYAIVIFIFTWNYSGNKKLIKIILSIYAILYCGNGLLFGDRSSAFPMILAMILLLYKDKINMKKVIVIGLIGILFANTVDVLRNNGYNFNRDVIFEVADRAMFVNTISYSHYAGTQILRYGEYSDNHFNHFIDYSLSTIKGKTSKYDLARDARNNGFINKGGSISSNYFYYWFGYIGTVIFGIIIGRIINKVFNSNKSFFAVISMCITIYSLRWIVYFPIAFFRTSIFIPFICYFTLNVFDRILCKKKKLFIEEE